MQGKNRVDDMQKRGTRKPNTARKVYKRGDIFSIGVPKRIDELTLNWLNNQYSVSAAIWEAVKKAAYAEQTLHYQALNNQISAMIENYISDSSQEVISKKEDVKVIKKSERISTDKVEIEPKETQVEQEVQEPVKVINDIPKVEPIIEQKKKQANTDNQKSEHPDLNKLVGTKGIKKKPLSRNVTLDSSKKNKIVEETLSGSK